jgi:hypothetical protein
MSLISDLEDLEHAFQTHGLDVAHAMKFVVSNDGLSIYHGNILPVKLEALNHVSLWGKGLFRHGQRSR